MIYMNADGTFNGTTHFQSDIIPDIPTEDILDISFSIPQETINLAKETDQMENLIDLILDDLGEWMRNGMK